MSDCGFVVDLTVAFLGDFVELVTSGTFTFKRPHGVDAVSSLTDAWNGLALVHICAHQTGHTYYFSSRLSLQGYIE